MNYAIGAFVFNDWQITREIGEGATGKVFEIEKNDSVITAKSALKVIRIPRSVSDVKTVMSEGMDEKSVTQYFREFVDEILREIKVMVSLKDHPNIVAYEDHTVIAHEDGVGWDILIKMELLTPLTEWMLNHPIDENTTIRIGSEISSALTYAFDNGLVHRDVKPENIFVDHTGHFKIGDFGIARTIEKTTGGLSKKGTESYMAPEVYLGKPYNEQIDIYSLGIVLYRLMNNNRLPFYPPIDQKISFSDREAALMKRVQGTPLPAPCNGSKEFQAIILKACEYLPENRYGTMHELYNDLQKLKKTTREIPPIPVVQIKDNLEEKSDSITVKKVPDHTVETASAVGKKRKTLLAIAGIFLAVGLGGFGLYYYINASQTYPLNIENGAGGGNYKAGETVTITANEPESGYTFSQWKVSEGTLPDLVMNNLNSEEISFTMPKIPLKLVAQYKLADGYMTWEDESGNTFTGYRKDGKLEGEGTMETSEGDIYEGDFVNGLLNGDGKVTKADGAIYEGAFVDSVPNGTGKYTYIDGRIYKGDVVNDMPNGIGKYTFTNGNTYEGDVTNGIANGKGKDTYQDGATYEGDFVNGNRQGKGKYTYADGAVYEGGFINDDISGNGKYTSASGATYEGDFINGGAIINGKFTDVEGNVFEGRFVNTYLDGEGKATFTNGDIYEGEFTMGHITGKGKFTFADGTISEGDFVDGQLQE